MENTGLQEHSRSTNVMSVQELIRDKNLILHVVKEAMVKDMDFGVIPGCAKNSLYKPGAEKLGMMFRLAGEPSDVIDIGGPDEIRYRVTTKFTHGPSGVIVSYGVGEASSSEEKYKWRKATCQEEFDDTPEDRRRKKWVPIYENKKKVWDKKRRQYIMEPIQQVRTQPADLANTILKMADKRSYISGILKATAASSIFTQDLEDLSKEVADMVSEGEENQPADPIAKPGTSGEGAAESDAMTPEQIALRSSQIVRTLDSMGITGAMIGEYCKDHPELDSEEMVLLKLERVAANLLARKVNPENAFDEPKATAPKTAPKPQGSSSRGGKPANWILMQSKKDAGFCSTCDKGITKGANIYWDPAKKQAHHEAC